MTEPVDSAEPAADPTAARGEPAAAVTEKPDQGKGKKDGSFLRELPFLLLIAFVLALVVKTFLIQAFFIPSGSMEQTLQVRDRVLVNKLVYKLRDVKRGEIVVFNGLDSFTPEVRIPPPANGFESFRRKLSNLLGLGQPGERDFIKRVIGLPGDTVACCTNGRVTVNGVELNEPYLYEDDRQRFGPETVPKGRVWVMGDHRGRSSDSRINGSVPIDRIVGRAFVVVWPTSHFKGLPVPREIEDAKVPRPAGALGALGLPARAWSVSLLPPVLGLAGALPVTLLRRRLRRRASRRRSPG